ncbi:MAG: radical SAM protein [Candidatus Helarchaeota archaeon]
MPKLKTCTYNCVYCELGKTSLKGLVGINYRCEVPPHFSEDFKAELRAKLVECASYIKVIIIGYNGEPTLNKNLDLVLEILHKIRYETGIEKVPVATLINSSTIGDARIRTILSKFDLVVAKLDAGTQSLFYTTNLPHHSVPSLEKIIENLILLKQELEPRTSFYIQTLLFKSQSDFSIRANNTTENLLELAKAIKQICPEQLQIYSVSRPPANPAVKALSKLELVKASDRLAELLKGITEVYYFH